MPATPSDDGIINHSERIRSEFGLGFIGKFIRESDIRRSRRIFVNRNLRMEAIDLIGFDMDYTLAIYNQPRIEALSIRCTLEKLVAQRGYPRAILNLDFDPTFALRGLVVDRVFGNIFKADRYGHVGRVYHGGRKLDKEERRRLYLSERIRLSQPRYAWIDTLFALPEAVMFHRITDYLDQKTDRPRYNKLWRDVRESIDEAHRDETMKRVIKANRDQFLERDPDLAPTLHKLRSAGKRLFLLTNSFWDYTNCVMSWLLDGQLPSYPSWRNYFDVIVVGAQKPAFFTERRPFVELDAQGNEKGPAVGALARGRIYQGGNVAEFEEGVGGGGDRVLYVGDHIYGDMLRAKKSSVWRTAMIIQELERELEVAEAMADRIARIDELDRRRNRLDAESTYEQLILRSLQRLEHVGNGNNGNGPRLAVDEKKLEMAKLEVKDRMERLRAAQRETEAELQPLELEVDRAFNPWWGPMLKEGVENSRFGEQVEDFACLYTSRVSNFLSYSPLQYFRSPRDYMPHEL